MKNWPIALKLQLLDVQYFCSSLCKEITAHFIKNWHFLLYKKRHAQRHKPLVTSATCNQDNGGKIYIVKWKLKKKRFRFIHCSHCYCFLNQLFYLTKYITITKLYTWKKTSCPNLETDIPTWWRFLYNVTSFLSNLVIK